MASVAGIDFLASLKANGSLFFSICCKVLQDAATNPVNQTSKTMKTNRFALLFFALLLTGLVACQKDETIEPQKPTVTIPADTIGLPTDTIPDPLDTLVTPSLLWEITGNGLTQPAHLYGTIHILPADDFMFTETLDSYLENATSLMLELDLGDQAVMDAANSRSMLPNPNDADELYTAEQEQKLANFCIEFQINWTQINTMKPFAIEGYLGSQALQANYPNNEGYDSYLYQKAIALDIPIVGAEPASYVMTYVDKIPVEDQVASLIRFIDFYNDDQTAFYGSFEHLVDTYLEQDPEVLRDLTVQDLPSQDYVDAILDDRSAYWVPAIMDGLSGRFVAVGAAHLGGSKGLIALLRAEGYTLQPVTLAK